MSERYAESGVQNVHMKSQTWPVLIARGGVTYEVSVVASNEEEALRLANDVLDRDGTEQWPVYGQPE